MCAGKYGAPSSFATETRNSAQPKPMPSTTLVDHEVKAGMCADDVSAEEEWFLVWDPLEDNLATRRVSALARARRPEK